MVIARGRSRRTTIPTVFSECFTSFAFTDFTLEPAPAAAPP